jgi:signal transduction histidine kinase
LLFSTPRIGEEFPIVASISQLDENGTMFYTVILRDVTERVRAENALRQSKEELQELASASQSVREQEKSRIARELHDELGQALTALKMDVNWLRERVVDKPEKEEKLAAMEALLDRTVAATRRISADLRPLMLDDLGLVPAVEWLVENFATRTGVSCQLHLSDPEPELHDPYATAVFRIVQEALTNVARHAGATRVDAWIRQSDGKVSISVVDNGQGFSPTDARKPKSFGLLGLRERAYLLGGDAKIESTPGLGTRVEVTLPIVEEESA